MEQQVVSLYDKGVLTKDVLNTLMQPFCGSDIDSGGSQNLKTKDGKSADDVICFIMESERYREATENFAPDPGDPDYNRELFDLCYEITRREWNFW
jgi:hypothetical protein